MQHAQVTCVYSVGYLLWLLSIALRTRHHHLDISGRGFILTVCVFKYANKTDQIFLICLVILGYNLGTLTKNDPKGIPRTNCNIRITWEGKL